MAREQSVSLTEPREVHACDMLACDWLTTACKALQLDIIAEGW